MTLKKQHLGEFYKELRLARGIKLKEVANACLSISQLSKFENGQSSLTVEKLFIALEAIHVSLAEFEHMANGYQENAFIERMTRAGILTIQRDIEGLLVLREEMDQTKKNDTYCRLNNILTLKMLASIDANYCVPEADKKFLVKYLYEIEAWTEYEAYLFGNTMPLLSDQDLIFLKTAFLERNKFYKSLPNHRKQAQTILLNCLSELIERGLFEGLDETIKEIEELITFQDMFSIVILNFLKLIVEDIQEENKKAEIETYIETIATLGNKELAGWFKFKATTFQIL
ncbi:helix-turn-helix domain-containing protein [Streptococcus merionis]|uniref:helix-turn-helix domain-containing protein n=1 Tax=Streptococcus merionis TaxID=400065 RepID=UPI003512054A